jgi:hypothetical protein
MPKPPVKAVTVRFRALQKDLVTWKRLATADAMTLSTWIRNRLHACDRDAEISQLRAVLIEVRGFLRGIARRPELGNGSKDLLDEAARIERVLTEAKETLQ